MVHMPQVTAARRDSTYDFAETFRYVKPVFDSADLVVVNLETTVSAEGNYSGYPIFASPPELVRGLKESGVDIVTLANNHICDKGKKGLEATVEAIETAGVQYTGAFADSAAYERLNPLMVEVNGIGLALLNYTYGTNGMPIPGGAVVNLIDTAHIGADLAKIERESTDLVIVCFHWGVEYSRNPAPQEKSLAQWCRTRGVDVVVGMHPHVIQPIEALRDSAGNVTAVTAYSLGNLVSNQRKRYTDGGMLLRLDITHCDSLPLRIEPGYMLTWTSVNYENGRKSYHILPPNVADTALAGGSEARAAYDLFISDSRELLGRQAEICRSEGAEWVIPAGADR